MPSLSKAQQRLMGQAYAVRKGDLDLKDIDPEYRDEIEKLAKGMKKKDLESFAKTKHKGLPERVPESYEEFLDEGKSKPSKPLELRKIMRVAKKYGSAPFAVIAVDTNKGKVLKQEIGIKTYELIPAFYREMAKEFPDAEIRVEDSTGQSIKESNANATLGSVNGMGSTSLPSGDTLGSGDIPHDLTGATAEDDTVDEDSNFDYHIDTIKKAEDYLALNGMESVGEIKVFVNKYLSDREIRPDDEKLIASLEFFKNRLGEKPNPKSTKLGKYLVKNKLAESVNEAKMTPDEFSKIKKGDEVQYMGTSHEVVDNNGYVLTLKHSRGTFKVNLAQFSRSGRIKEPVNEASDVKKEYEALKKASINWLRQEWSRNQKVGDPKGLDKNGLISDLLRWKFGNKRVAQAFGLNEAKYKVGDKIKYSFDYYKRSGESGTGVIQSVHGDGKKYTLKGGGVVYAEEIEGLSEKMNNMEYFKTFEDFVNEAKNTIGLAFKDEDEYKDFKEFAEDNGAKIYKDKGFDSKTKSWYIEMEESQLAHIYGDIQPGNKNSGWMAIKDDFESVIVS